MKSKLAVSNAIYIKPLTFCLGNEDSLFELVSDVPARNALKLSGRSEEIRGAFLSPIDYARHGGEYCIVPGICASSNQPTGTIQLFINRDRRNIETVAIDISFTSEIILANIILKERIKNFPTHSKLQFIPSASNIDEMLKKADAALIVNESLKIYENPDYFILDLVEEWNDMTGLPYVHGFWVGREEEFLKEEANALIEAKNKGVSSINQIAEEVNKKCGVLSENVSNYLSKFSYDFGKDEVEGLSEFIHYAYYHGIINDVPDIRFFDLK